MFSHIFDDDDDDFVPSNIGKKQGLDVKSTMAEPSGKKSNPSVSPNTLQNSFQKFKTIHEVNAAVDKFQNSTGTSYFVRRKDKIFGQQNYDLKSHRILFEDDNFNKKAVATSCRLPFTGVPFIILGTQDLECIHGVDHKCLIKL